MNSRASLRVRLATGSDHAFLPKQAIRESRDIAHVNASAHDDPAWSDAREGLGNQVARRREDHCSIERRRGRGVRRPSPRHADVTGEPHGHVVARRDEGVDLPPITPGDLGDDVGGRAESIETQTLPASRHAIRSIADETRAEQWGGVDIIVGVWERHRKLRIGNRVLCVAPIEGVAGEPRLAQRFSRPVVQNPHVPHVSPSHGTPTRSPTLKPWLPGPTSATRPTISCPGTIGILASGNSPSTTCRSVRHTPQALTAITIWPGAARGIARSVDTRRLAARSSSVIASIAPPPDTLFAPAETSDLKTALITTPPTVVVVIELGRQPRTMSGHMDHMNEMMVCRCRLRRAMGAGWTMAR